MKKIFLILSIFLCLQTFANTEIKIIKVYDGDTVLATIKNNSFRIRLIDIDCFEGTINDRAKWQAKRYKLDIKEVIKRGNLARDYLKKELNNKKAQFSFMGIDKYNRALGYIFVDNKNINQEMLKTPYCFKYKKDINLIVKSK